jgi:hypothetical protein
MHRALSLSIALAFTTPVWAQQIDPNAAAHTNHQQLGNVKAAPEQSADDAYFDGIFSYAVGGHYLGVSPVHSSAYTKSSGWDASLLMEYRSKYGLEIMYGGYKSNVKNVVQQTLAPGSLDINPFLVNIHYVILNRRIAPFISGGLGYATVHYRGEPGYTYYGYPYKATIENGPMYDLGAGLTFYPTQGRRLALEISYLRILFNPTVKQYVVYLGQEYWIGETSVSLNSDIFRVGASYRF